MIKSIFNSCLKEYKCAILISFLTVEESHTYDVLQDFCFTLFASSFFLHFPISPTSAVMLSAVLQREKPSIYKGHTVCLPSKGYSSALPRR